MMYDPTDLPCALCSSEVGQEPAGAHVGAGVAPDIQKRLISLCEAVSGLNLQQCSLTGTPSHNVAIEARAIMATLTKPSPIQRARDIVADLYEAGDNLSEQHRKDYAQYMREGAYDDELAIRAVVVALEQKS